MKFNGNLLAVLLLWDGFVADPDACQLLEFAEVPLHVLTAGAAGHCDLDALAGEASPTESGLSVGLLHDGRGRQNSRCTGPQCVAARDLHHGCSSLGLLQRSR
jgi:hypothetical protein